MSLGSWSSVYPWPIIGIHAALLPDGRVLTFGSDQLGEQGGHKIYDIWDPKTGLHLTTTDAIQTDEFCSAEIMDPITGNMLIAGGDGRPQGNVNKGVPDFNTFDYQADSLTASTTGHLNYPRWYPSLISLGEGRFLVMGGTDNQGKGVGTPEIYTPGEGWKALPGAYNADIATNWWYPRQWLSSNGGVFGFSAMSDGNNAGTLFRIDPTGQGTITNLGHTPFESENYDPAAMFAPDKILTIDKNGNGWIIDISGATPTFTQTGGVGEDRAWSNLTDLADGTVLLTGGSVGVNNLATETNNAEIWNPATGQWTNDASAAIGRFYHSNTLLLPDGTVLSAGGGAPGPLTNLNAEVYTPGYLLNADGSLRTDRPVITAAPKTLQEGQTFTLTLDNADVIKTLELIKYGNATHSFNAEQRAFGLSFTHVDAHTLQVTIPANTDLITDGYWMLFADNMNGTPSIAATIKIGQVGVDTSVPNIGTGFMLNGTAEHTYGSNIFTLNTDNSGQAGSAMSDTRIDLTHDFNIAFSLLMGNKAVAADGMAFVLHNDPSGNGALGQGGGGLGAAGLLNGIAIQFDTWQNVNQGDIAANHTDIATTDPRATVYRLSSQLALQNVTDGQWHNVDVQWSAATQLLTYTFDNKQVGQVQLNSAQLASYFGGSNYVYFGFTAATGGASDLHQIELNSVNASFEAGSPPGLPHPGDGSIFDVSTIAQHTTDNGSASYQAVSNTITLTPNVPGQTGSVFFNDKVNLTHDFNIEFDVYFGPNHPADGMAFVLQNDPNGIKAVGGGGGYLGAIGLQNGLALEFDTWQNGTPFKDPAYNHTDIINTAAGPGGDLTPATNLGNIVDGGWHQVGVTWDSQAHTLRYWVDGALGGSLTGDIATRYLGGQTTAYFGITGATGGASDIQQVRFASVDANLVNVSTAFADVQDPVLLSNAALVNGSATYDSGHHTFVLTPNTSSQSGAAMLSQRIDLTYDFQVSFDAYLGNNAKGADGIAMVLENDARGSKAIGVGGGAYGAIGIANGLGIALDTFQNANLGDMASDHTNFINTSLPLPASRISDQFPIANGNAKDGQWHNVLVNWSASNHTMTYTVDGKLAGSLNENITAKYLGGSQYAYLGFTGGTGGAHNLQQVHVDTLTAWFEGQSHPLNSGTAITSQDLHV